MRTVFYLSVLLVASAAILFYFTDNPPDRGDTSASASWWLLFCTRRVSISAVLRFRNALTFIEKEFPFTYAFGPASTREECIESAQNVYSRFHRVGSGEDGYINFDELATVALDDRGILNQQKARDLVKVFRPDREGRLGRKYPHFSRKWQATLHMVHNNIN